MKNKKPSLAASQAGATAVEFALILPIFALLMMGMLEFGLYFLKAQIGQRAVSAAANSIQANPDDITLEAEAYNSNTGFINFNTAGNYVCAQSYSTWAAANTGRCSTRVWNTAAPSGHAAGTAYYVAVNAFAAKEPLSPLVSGFIPDVRAFQIVKIGGTTSATTSGITHRQYVAAGYTRPFETSDFMWHAPETAQPGYRRQIDVPASEADFCALGVISSADTNNEGAQRYCQVKSQADGSWSLIAIASNVVGSMPVCAMRCFKFNAPTP